MKKIIKYVAILGMLFCMCGFLSSVCAENEVDLSSIDVRLSEVEKLKEKEIINHLLENEDKLTSHADFWMGTMGVFVSVMAVAIGIFGAFYPYLKQKKNNKKLEQFIKDIENKNNELEETLKNKQESIETKMSKLEHRIEQANNKLKKAAYIQEVDDGNLIIKKIDDMDKTEK